MKKNHDYFKFQVIYFIFVSASGFFFPYFNVYLEQELGFTGSDIGLVIAISLLTSVVISPLWGAISDKTGKYKLMLRALLFIYSVAAWLLFSVNTLFWVILFTTIMEAVGIGLSPMLDVLAVDYCERTGKDFGKLRIAASMGWVFGTYATGFLVTTFLFDLSLAMFVPLIGLMIIAGLLTFLLPNAASKDNNLEDSLATEKPSAKMLLKNKAFIFLMIYNFLTVSIIDAVAAFSGNHLVVTLGAEASAIGWMNVFAVVPEFILFFFATKMMNKIGFKRFYIIALLTLIARFAIYAFTGNVLVFLIASTLAPVMMIGAIIGNFMYIKKHVQRNLTGTAFMINAGILTLGRAFYSLLFGVIYEWFGSFTLFKVSIGFFIIALLILLPTKHFEIFDGKPLHITDELEEGMS